MPDPLKPLSQTSPHGDYLDPCSVLKNEANRVSIGSVGLPAPSSDTPAAVPYCGSIGLRLMVSLSNPWVSSVPPPSLLAISCTPFCCTKSARRRRSCQTGGLLVGTLCRPPGIKSGHEVLLCAWKDTVHDSSQRKTTVGQAAFI